MQIFQGKFSRDTYCGYSLELFYSSNSNYYPECKFLQIKYRPCPPWPGGRATQHMGRPVCP